MVTNMKLTLSVGLMFLAGLISCEDNSTPTVKTGKKTINKEFNDPNRSFNTTFDGKLFSIPSPIQTALLIKNAQFNFNEELLNPTDNLATYNAEVKKALNLGIFGADLGYTTLYDKNSYALKYLNAVELLSNDLGIAGAFDKDFLDRFENNLNNQDSMLVILSDAFRKGDSFLKQNKRKNVSALILAGGWIESMHFATNLYESSKNQTLLERIGEQKQSLQTLIEILEKYNDENANEVLIKQLKNLQTSFEKVTIAYTYVAPTTYSDQKVTIFNNETIVMMSDDVLAEIIQKTKDLRNEVAQ